MVLRLARPSARRGTSSSSHPPCTEGAWGNGNFEFALVGIDVVAGIERGDVEVDERLQAIREGLLRKGHGRVPPRGGLKTLRRAAGQFLHHLRDASFVGERTLLVVLDILEQDVNLERVDFLHPRHFAEHPGRQVHRKDAMPHDFGDNPRHILAGEKFRAGGTIAFPRVLRRIIHQQSGGAARHIFIGNRRALAVAHQRREHTEQRGKIDDPQEVVGEHSRVEEDVRHAGDHREHAIYEPGLPRHHGRMRGARCPLAHLDDRFKLCFAGCDRERRGRLNHIGAHKRQIVGPLCTLDRFEKLFGVVHIRDHDLGARLLQAGAPRVFTAHHRPYRPFVLTQFRDKCAPRFAGRAGDQNLWLRAQVDVAHRNFSSFFG